MHQGLGELLGVEVVDMEDDGAAVELDAGGEAVAHGIGTFTSVSS